jgi:hypothetical protein
MDAYASRYFNQGPRRAVNVRELALRSGLLCASVSVERGNVLWIPWLQNSGSIA